MSEAVTHDDVVHLFGEISDHTIVEILEVKPSYRELEEVAMRLAQENDVMGELERPLEGAAARVYDILVRAQEFPENERRR
jgi:hypothetical protein